MNFKQLEYIIAIDEHKLFSEAAFSCDVTQATLSAMVIRLEEEVGFQIFDRSTKPVSTTELGENLIAKAKDILAIKNSISHIGKELPKSIEGELKLGVIPTIANSLLSRILPAILEANPNLQLDVRELTTEEMVRKLKLGEIDLGIAATPLNDDNIEEEILYYEQMLVYGVNDAGRKYMLSENMLDDKIWLLEEGHCFRGQVATFCGLQKKNEDVENLVFDGNSFETLLSMVDAFGGYTLIPELYYLDMNTEEQKRSRKFQKPIPVREVSIVSYGPYHKTLTVQYLAKLIKLIITPLLTTEQYENRDLRIIGIS